MLKAYCEHGKHYYFYLYQNSFHHVGNDTFAPCKNQMSERIIGIHQRKKLNMQKQDHLLKGARTTDATNDGLGGTNIHVLDVARHSEDGSTVNTIEGARNISSVGDVDVADGLSDVGESPLFYTGNGDRPCVFCGVNEGDCYIGSLAG